MNARRLIIGLIVLNIVALVGAFYFTVVRPFDSESEPAIERAAPAESGDAAVTEIQVLFDEDEVTGLYERANPAVLKIETSFGSGSGFLIDREGHILTNSHVVENSSQVTVVLSGGSEIEGEVLGTDRADDVALVKVDPEDVAGITPLVLGDSDQAIPGQMAIALGSPYGLTGSVSVGVVSGLDRRLPGSAGQAIFDVIQTDAALSPGNSGGPLLNSAGEVIGINTAIEGQAGSGVGFAVAINTAKDVLPRLQARETISRPWLGIAGTTVTAQVAEDFDIAGLGGVYVDDVVDDSPAAEAGMSEGDWIRAVGGSAVESLEDLVTALNLRNAGDEVTVEVERDGSTLELAVTLAPWPAIQ